MRYNLRFLFPDTFLGGISWSHQQKSRYDRQRVAAAGDAFVYKKAFGVTGMWQDGSEAVGEHVPERLNLPQELFRERRVLISPLRLGESSASA